MGRLTGQLGKRKTKQASVIFSAYTVLMPAEQEHVLANVSSIQQRAREYCFSWAIMRLCYGYTCQSFGFE